MCLASGSIPFSGKIETSLVAGSDGLLELSLQFGLLVVWKSHSLYIRQGTSWWMVKRCRSINGEAIHQHWTTRRSRVPGNHRSARTTRLGLTQVPSNNRKLQLNSLEFGTKRETVNVRLFFFLPFILDQLAAHHWLPLSVPQHSQASTALLCTIESLPIRLLRARGNPTPRHHQNADDPQGV